jgi:A/G-specific adenine glycosylase
MAHYRDHARDLPWRKTRDPYHILVSEMMLQQTQVARVVHKYEDFLSRFPDMASLAESPAADVLAAWQGLGYNRRALALRECAKTLMAQSGGALPRTLRQLTALPGIGPATGGAILAFAHGIAVPFIETNIRAAFLHYFFPGREDVADTEILPLVSATLDREDPRTWYYALMDYGSRLKKTFPNPSRRSRHHRPQSAFEGSRRQLRAHVLRLFLKGAGGFPRNEEREASMDDAPPMGAWSRDDVVSSLPGWPTDEVEAVLAQLLREGFLRREGAHYALA